MRKEGNALNAIGESLLSNKLHKLKYLLGLMLCVAGIGLNNADAAPSDLDTSFGTNGVVFSDPDGTRNNYGKRMALQADGKIVMIGNKSPAGTGFTVARYNSSGSLDTGFGTNGFVSATFGGGSEEVRGVAIQADGKILVGGHGIFPTPNTASADLGVIRLNSNGSVDTSFGTNGVVIVGFVGTMISENYTDRFGAIKIAYDGKIVIGGNAVSSGMFHRASLARLNSDGSLDTTFGTGGKVLEEGYAWNDLVIQPNGSIATAGYSLLAFAVQRLACKYDANGVRVWRYISGGEGTQGYLHGIAAQPNGNFIVVGEFNGVTSVTRLIDIGGNTPFSSDQIMRPGRFTAVAVQRDGKIVISGVLNDTPFAGYNVIRLNADGIPDSSFGAGGVISNLYPNTQIIPATVIIQPDGKILVGGNATISPPLGYYFTMARYAGNPVAPFQSLFDYDGDGRADVSVFRPSENKWYVLQSSNSAVVQPVFGLAGDIPTPADFDGDGKTDVAVFRPSTGVWWYQSSLTNTQRAARWGQSGDIPKPSDFDGDGKADFIVYRPSNGIWYRLNSAGQSSQVAFGLSDDKPLIGDFDGDGNSDPAIYRPSTGTWWYAASATGGQHRAAQFGISTDTPAPADYDGDGKTDLAVYRAADGVWHILRSSNQSYTALQFGLSEDKPTAADYDGDGKADIAVFRPSTGVWYLLRSTSGFNALQWGISNDIPTQNSFVP